MNRLLILLALAGIGAAACGDDGDDEQTGTTASKDSGTATAAKTDAAVKDAAAVIRPQQIDTNKLGAACTAASECTGAGGTCLTTSMVGSYPGGYCSAACQADAECGPNGGCPLAAITSMFGGLIPAGTIPSNCSQKCTAASDCRAGYSCASLSSALSGLAGGAAGGAAGGLAGGLGAGFDIGSLLGAGASGTYCMPPVAIPDGILPSGDAGTAADAGSTTVVTGIDAGR